MKSKYNPSLLEKYNWTASYIKRAFWKEFIQVIPSQSNLPYLGKKINLLRIRNKPWFDYIYFSLCYKSGSAKSTDIHR